MNGRPDTGASAFGRSPTASRSRVPSPPHNTNACIASVSCIRQSSNIFQLTSSHHSIALEELLDAIVDTSLRFKPSLAKARVGHDVVSLVRIAAHLGVVQ